MSTPFAITGLGRMGRAALRIALERSGFKLVSMDFLGDPHSAIVDLPLNRRVRDLCRIVACYDNEDSSPAP